MSQCDIIEVLKKRRLSGDEAYYPVKDIYAFLEREGKATAIFNLYPQCVKLTELKKGGLETDKCFFRRNFRYRLK